MAPGRIGLILGSKFYSLPNIAYTYMHFDGCGEPSFMADRKPVPGERVSAEGMYHVDGRKVLNGDICCCDTCGEQFFIGDLVIDNFIKTVGQE